MPRILVVDDDPHVARTLVDLLALHEYKAERAESGEKALELVRTRPKYGDSDFMQRHGLHGPFPMFYFLFSRPRSARLAQP